MATTKKQFTPADFYSLPRAKEGARVYLRTLDGKETEHYLLVMGLDAPAAQQALGESAHRVQEARVREKAEETITALKGQEALQFRASLVLGWSFSASPALEEIRDLLANNPGLAVRVEQFATTPTLFFSTEKFYA
jgi:hypothetical protein